MKIITRKQMLSMPDQTLYWEYEPCCFDKLRVKRGDPDPEGIDFACDDMDQIKCTGSSDMFEILDDAKNNSTSFDMNLEYTGRDGMFEDKQLYVVYEQEDILQLIERLKKCLKI